MLTDATRRPGHRRVELVVTLGILIAVGALAAIGLWVYGVYSMSAPDKPVVPGARVEGETIVIKFPLCSTDVIRRVEVTDSDDTSNYPQIVWWASNPTTPATRRGVVKLWSGDGFERRAPEPAKSAVPRNLVVGYLDPSGHGRDGVFTLRTISTAKLKPGQYWTDYGPMTAAQIDAQLNCNNGTSTPTPKPKTD
ncbi:hypothetical protein [Streptomyces cavernae]|uniref:hypothetical protein n=1 Tax=Streptomyces cavernae TaxID=2259034 RepID=UPI001EE4BCA6|nr:hypothetical protein [Streptomyces cavernae]